MQKHFLVTFYKTVTTDYGNDQEIKQRALEVFAEDEAEALETAKAEFARLEGLTDWSLRANRCTVEQPDEPS